MKASKSQSALLLAVAMLIGAACSSSPDDPGNAAGRAGSTVVTGGGAGTTGGSAAVGSGGATGGNAAGSGGSASGGAGSGGAAGVTGGAGGAGAGGSASGGGGSAAAGAGGTGAVSDGGAGDARTSDARGGAGGSDARAPDGAGGPAGPSDAGAPAHREIVMYNDGEGELIYVNNATPAMGWRVTSGTGRDLQLIGGGRVMLGKSTGWDEYQLSNGARVAGVTSLAGTQATHRLADGTTMVASLSATGILLRMVNATGQVQRQITYAGYTYVRLVRPTAAGTFLVTADTKVFEGDGMGNVIWEVTVPGTALHVWKAMRLANGNTALASGYGKTILIYNAARTLVQTIGGTPALASVYPQFFADFHVMPNGNYFVVNSQADRTEDRSIQLLEFTAAGDLVWQQKQPAMVRSLEAAIVLDGLDRDKLYVEPEGLLVPAP